MRRIFSASVWRPRFPGGNRSWVCHHFRTWGRIPCLDMAGTGNRSGSIFIKRKSTDSPGFGGVRRHFFSPFLGDKKRDAKAWVILFGERKDGMFSGCPRIEHEIRFGRALMYGPLLSPRGEHVRNQPFRTELRGAKGSLLEPQAVSRLSF